MRRTPICVETQILQFYREGVVISDIAQKCSVSMSAVRKVLKRNNVQGRDPKVYNARSAHKRLKLTPHQAEEMKCKYENGLSTASLAEEYNLNPSTIVQYLKRRGVVINQYDQRRKHVDVDIDELTRLYESGMSLREVASLLGVTVSVATDRLVGAKTPLRPRNEKVSIPVNHCIALYNFGFSMAKLSEIFACSEWVIWKNFRDAGVETRGPDHPSRKLAASRAMSERISKRGDIKIGNNEHKMISLLIEAYGDVEEQFQLRKGGHHYDAYAGGILWELDEKRHREKRQKALDRRYDLEALECGIEVRRIWEWDLETHGISIWHNYQMHEQIYPMTNPYPKR